MVNAISSISYLGNSSASAVDSEYLEILRKLRELGITPTGVKATDKRKLEEAEEAIRKVVSKQIEKNSQDAAVPQELIKILGKLGIESSGNINDDISKALSAIQNKLATSSSESEKVELRDDKKEVEKIAANSQSNGAIGSVMLGVSAMSDYNKKMLVSNISGTL